MTREEMRELIRFSNELDRRYRVAAHNRRLDWDSSLRDRYSPQTVGEYCAYRLQCREDERRHPEWYVERGAK